MTSSRSSRWLIVLACLALWASSAYAGRKRLVVLDFDGPGADKFHADVVKLIKKSHTVLPVEKWNSAAEELGADAVTDKNVKKVAKKLKIDGVVTGKIEKRRDEYIVRIKLRAGTTGALTPNPVQTKSGDARLDAQSQRDLKDELLPAIDELEANHGGGGDDEAEEDAPPPKKKKVVEEEEEAPPPKKSGFARKNGDDEEKASKKKKVVEEEEEAPPPKSKKDKKKLAEEERAALATKKDKEEEDAPPPKKRAKSEDEEDDKKKTASAEEEEEEQTDKVEEEEPAGTSDKAANVSPSRRAIDAAIGLSFVRRNLSFSYESTLGKPPPGYRQLIPVAGAYIDLTIFPLSFNHKPSGLISGLGVTALYDRVLIINSQKKYADAQGMQQVADLDTSEERWALGLVLRYPFNNKDPKSAVVGGQLTYGQQKFLVEQTLPNMEKTDIPNVQYSMLSPGAFIRYPLGQKIILNADLAFHMVLGAGPITEQAQYGKATVLGFDIEAGGDYMLTSNIFLRAALRFEIISLSFSGDAMSQSNTRDTDPEQDVTGASDQYMGASIVAGYLF